MASFNLTSFRSAEGAGFEVNPQNTPDEGGMFGTKVDTTLAQNQNQKPVKNGRNFAGRRHSG
jgi:hypothetical protein